MSIVAEIFREYLSFEEEVGPEDARVVRGVQVLIRGIVVETRQIHDRAEPVVRHLGGALRVAELRVVLGVQRVGQLAFVAPLVGSGRVGPASDGKRPVLFGLGEAAGAKEPESVVQDWAAGRALVHRGDLVDRLIGGVRCQRSPAIVVERRAKRAAECVAAGFRDHVHDAAAEAAVLSGDRPGRDFRFLDRVFDEQIQRLAAQVLVHDDAVDQVLAFERHPAGHHDVAARTVAGDAWREEHGIVQGASDWQTLERFLLEIAGNRGRRHNVRRLSGHRDRLGHGRERKADVQRQRFSHGQRRRSFQRLKTLKLERHRVIARRQKRNDVVAVGGRCGRARALEYR